MKQTTFAILLVAATALSSACGQNAQKAVAASSEEEVKQALLQLQREEDEAEAKNDFAALDRILSGDELITIGDQLTSHKEFYEGLKKSGPDSSFVPPQYEDVVTHVYGNTAVMNYLVTFTQKDKSGVVHKPKYRITVTWVKQQDRWKTVATHVSYVPPPKDAAQSQPGQSAK